MRAAAGRRIRARGTDRRSLARNSSCTTSACCPATSSRNWPRPSSTRSAATSCTAATSTTISSSCARWSRPSTSRPRSRSRPTASTTRHGRPALHAARIVTNFQLAPPVRRPRRATSPWSKRAWQAFGNCDGWSRTSRCRCCRACSSATRAPTSSAAPSTARANTRSSCRSCTTGGELLLDTVLFDHEQIAMLFSFTRAYFLVDMEVPSAYVQFLRTPDAAQAAQRDLHRARPAKAGQDAVLPRLPAAPEAQSDRSTSRPAFAAW
jgi:hypothetical protein